MSSTNPLKKTVYGNIGLKVSRIILGLASHGNKSWAEWALEEEEEEEEEEEGIKHIKAA